MQNISNHKYTTQFQLNNLQTETRYLPIKIRICFLPKSRVRTLDIVKPITFQSI